MGTKTEREIPREKLEPDAPRERGKVNKGFAAMDRRVVSEIARKGGRSAHAMGVAHQFTSEEARAAGRKGGQATAALRRGHAAE